MKPDPERDLKGLRVAVYRARTLDQYSYLEQSIEWLWQGLDTDQKSFREALKWHEETCSVIGRNRLPIRKPGRPAGQPWSVS